jgi:hypothetical protein
MNFHKTNRFDPSSIKSFGFVARKFDEKSGIAKFYYAFDNGLTFVEHLLFPGPRLPMTAERRQALDRCLDVLHLMLGISYYKAAVPPAMVIQTFAISKRMARFFEKLYVHGLGEFAYRNQIDVGRRIHFPFSRKVSDRPSEIHLPPKAWIPVGGGKDSIVTIEALKSDQRSLSLFSLGAFDVIEKVARTAQLPLITVKRKICPNLFKINQQGAYNGHVPISAIIAFVLPVCAVLYGFDTAVMSNERSANVGNLMQNGREINHQYSKGYEFEMDVSTFFNAAVLKNFTYFSMLRPLSDLGIAKAFAGLPAYHANFRSCNRAFRLNPSRRGHAWCLACPKCRFTFLALAPFMQKNKLLTVFSHNLLDDPRHIHGFDELMGLGSHKPFECVGEVNESLAAFFLLSGHPDWRRDALVCRFAQNILPTLTAPDVLVKDALAFSPNHQLPHDYLKVLHAYLGS